MFRYSTLVLLATLLVIGSSAPLQAAELPVPDRIYSVGLYDGAGNIKDLGIMVFLRLDPETQKGFFVSLFLFTDGLNWGEWKPDVAFPQDISGKWPAPNTLQSFRADIEFGSSFFDYSVIFALVNDVSGAELLLVGGFPEPLG